VLQLGDDLQDVQSDRQRGSRTLFSQAARREPLDALTNRTFDFGQKVMARMSGLRNSAEALKELLTRSSRVLLIRSAATVPKLYTERYLAELEHYSPFGFAFLRSREKRLSKRSRRYAHVCERLLESTMERAQPTLPARDELGDCWRPVI